MKKFSIALAPLLLLSAGSVLAADQMMGDQSAKMQTKDSAQMMGSAKMMDSMKKEPTKMDEKKTMGMKKKDKQ